MPPKTKITQTKIAPLKASASVKTSLAPQPKGGIEFSMSGRGPSYLNHSGKSGTIKEDGDHTTSYALVEEGCLRMVNPILSKEVDQLSQKENRDIVRKKRSNLYDYVSAIAILDFDQNFMNELYAGVDKTLAVYNEARHSKTQIKADAEAFHSDPQNTDATYEASLKGLESKLKDNANEIREVYRGLSALVMTYYNKIPGTAYHIIKGFEAPESEGATTKKVKNTTMKGVVEWAADSTVTTSAVMTAKISTIADALNDFIFYPQITDANALMAHEAENTGKHGGKPRNPPRNNNKDTLVDTLAKHVFIFAAVYPEVVAKLGNDMSTLIDEFTRKFINKDTSEKKDGTKKNWPTFANDADIADIQAKVKARFSELTAKKSASHYNKWKENQKALGINLDSSDDEVDVVPKAKPTPKSATTLSAVSLEADIEAMRQELVQLRLIRDIIEKRRGEIPKEVMQEIDGIQLFKAKPKALATHGNSM